MATLDQLLAAKEGWDGPGSLPVSLDAVADYRRLLAAVQRHRDAERHLEPIAGGDGSVRMEWDNRGWSYVGEIHGDGTYYVCALGPRHDGTEDWDKTLTDLADLIDFYELSISSCFKLTLRSWKLLKKERAQLEHDEQVCYGSMRLVLPLPIEEQMAIGEPGEALDFTRLDSSAQSLDDVVADAPEPDPELEVTPE